MLAGGTDLLYRNALATSHEPYFRVEVWRGDERLIDDLVYLSGQLRATLASRVSRTLNLSVYETMYPFSSDDVLAPFGNYVRLTGELNSLMAISMCGRSFGAVLPVLI